VKKGQTFEAKVFAQADAAGPATIRLYRNEQFLGEQKVHLAAGKNLFSFPQSLPESGFYNYDIHIDSPDDEVPQNNRAFAFTQALGAPRVLLVSSDPAADAPLARVLASPELEVKVAGVNQFPGSLAEMQSYDAIILDNVLAGDLSRDQQSQLESAVRDFGTGLVCIGGDQAYGAGAYRGTPLAEMLPVDVELSSKKVMPIGALVLIIDRSGSMGGPKIEMARQSAMGAVAALSPNDYVAVIAFDTQPETIVDIQPARDKDSIMRSIQGIEAGGGTVMYPAMARAHEMLRNVQASIKHCVILTDGISEPGAFKELTTQMALDRITVSTVGIGGEIDGKLLADIAATGKGRFYPVPDPEELPQIFIKETAIILKSAISEEPFKPRWVAPSELLRGFPVSDFPQLLGYVVTEPKARAETPLVTEKGDPLLAHWQFGLGRTVAFTSDARSKWARNWISWSRFGQFWRQTVQWSLRRVDNAHLALEATMDQGEGRISADALDAEGNFRNFLNLQTAVVSPDGVRENIVLSQTAPGHYEGSFTLRETGSYLLNVAEMENGQVRASQVLGASLNYSPEFESSAPNLGLLRRIAESTGGKVIDTTAPGSNPFYDDRRKTWQPHDLAQSLLKLAILLFVLDVGIRRLSLDSEQMEKGWQRFRAAYWRKEPAIAAASEPSLAALLSRRDEMRARKTVDPALFQTRHPQYITPETSATPALPALTSLDDPEPEADAAQPVPPQTTTGRLLEAKRRAAARK
jgi:uncharacterized membrane protein